ncbi:MAG: hypothetical protein Q9217_001733 [Psora testacea]
MSPVPPTKRRRLDNASHTLSQPFKSPFKTPLKAKPANEANTPVEPALNAPDVGDAQLPPKVPLSYSVLKPQANRANSPTVPPECTIPLSSLAGTPKTITASTLLTLQKRHTHLLAHLSNLRTKLETSQQALKIESSTRDTELQFLIEKWRSASQAAAEEVFRGVRDRVNRMGGVGALREKERERREREGIWRREEREAELEKLEEERERVREEREEDGDAVEVEVDDGEGLGEREADAEREVEEEDMKKEDDGVCDDDGYTMDMMLKSLNIELGIIGFDKESQRWVD